jgi:hypothetical protein
MAQFRHNQYHIYLSPVLLSNTDSEAHTVSYSSLLNQHTPSFSTQEIIAHQQKSIITAHQKNHDKLSVLYCHCLSNATLPTQTPGMGSKNWGTYQCY